MAKKTLFLICILALIPIGLLLFTSLKKNIGSAPLVPPVINPQPTPTPKAQTTLSFSPNPIVIASPSGTLNLSIDSGANNVTAVQLELSYDPKTLPIVDILPGTFFDDPITLLKNVDAKNGKISYVIATPLTGKAKNGKGTVATLTFTTRMPSGQKTAINFTPKTLVTAENIPTSVLKATDSATIFFVQSASTAAQTNSQEEIGPFKPEIPTNTTSPAQ